MPVSANAVKLGRWQSRVSALTVSTAVGSLETVLVNHGLGKTPDKVRAILRCIRAAISTYPQAVFLSANASTALLLFNSGLGQANADWDLDCEIVHTAIR